jgi:60 kDa SS-A/Ro ribonucleoprotein
MSGIDYLKQAAAPRQTPQSEPVPGTSQVANSAGGYAWEVSSMDRLRRFCILSSSGGSYYATERDLTRQNIDGVRAALDEHKTAAVAEIVAISKEGRAPKNDPALYALAVACAHEDVDVRRAACAAIKDVARTGTHLFHFAEFVETQRSWGPVLKKGVAAWYEREDVDQLAYQLVKYRQRDGWTHKDVIGLCHPNAPTPQHAALYDWAVGREGRPFSMVPTTDEKNRVVKVARSDLPDLLGLGEAVEAFRAAQEAPNAHATAALISEHGSVLPREALKTEHLNSVEVWEALLEAGMPMTAMLRNLATMTRIGVLKPMGDTTGKVVDQLANEDQIRKARVHPLSVLGALVTYASGQSARGSNSWQPLREIVDALDKAFYLAFGNVQPTGKRTLLGLDVSGSMGGPPIAAMPGVSPRVASAAMALVTAAVEPRYQIMAFSDTFMPLDISPRERLDDVVRRTDRMPFGRTDCALPMVYALSRGLEVDTFLVYTDSETYANPRCHPIQALDEYQRQSGIPAKLIVVGMTSGGFTIADPNRNDCLDVVGFDTATPDLISDFSAGRL